MVAIILAALSKSAPTFCAYSLYGESSLLRKILDKYSNPCRSRKFFTPPQPSPNSRGGSKKFTNDLGLLYQLPYIVSIRSDHGVWLPCHQRVRANKWCQFESVFSDVKSENRYIREIIYGKKGSVTYWEIQQFLAI